MKKFVPLMFLLCAAIHVPITCMQLTRIARKSGTHKIRSVRRYTTGIPLKSDSSEEKETVISYRGKKYAPAEFVQHAMEQAITKGVHYIQSKCVNEKDEAITCTCIKPYFIIPFNSPTPAHISNQSALKGESYSETLTEIMERLNIALDHFKDDKQVLAKLTDVQNKLCPNLQKCESAILGRDHKKLKKEWTLVGKKVAVWGLMLYAGGSYLNIASFGTFTVGFFIAAQRIAPNNIRNRETPQDEILQHAMYRYLICQKALVRSALKEVCPTLPQNPDSKKS